MAAFTAERGTKNAIMEGRALQKVNEATGMMEQEVPAGSGMHPAQQDQSGPHCVTHPSRGSFWPTAWQTLNPLWPTRCDRQVTWFILVLSMGDSQLTVAHTCVMDILVYSQCSDDPVDNPVLHTALSRLR